MIPKKKKGKLMRAVAEGDTSRSSSSIHIKPANKGKLHADLGVKQRAENPRQAPGSGEKERFACGKEKDRLRGKRKELES